MVKVTDTPPDDSGLRDELDRVEAKITQLLAVRAHLRERLGIEDATRTVERPTLAAAIDSVLRAANGEPVRAGTVAKRISRMENKPACVITTKTVTKCLLDNPARMRWERRDDPEGRRIVHWVFVPETPAWLLPLSRGGRSPESASPASGLPATGPRVR